MPPENESTVERVERLNALVDRCFKWFLFVSLIILVGLITVELAIGPELNVVKIERQDK